MPDNFQFGSEHYLYIACGAATGDDWQPIPYDSLAAGGGSDTVNTVKWGNVITTGGVDFSNIRDLSLQGNENTVNITTRAEARQGASTEVIVNTAYQLSFESRWQKHTNDTTPKDKIAKALIRAAQLQSEVAGLVLDQPIATDGAFGFSSNWTVAVTQSAPVEGVVACQFSMRSATFPEWVIASDALGNSFGQIAAVAL